MDNREKRFAIEYAKNGRNATKAALAAGYSSSTASHATDWLTETTENSAKKSLHYKPELVDEINRLTENIREKASVTAEEVMEYWASVMRGEAQSYEIVNEGTGKGYSQARLMPKTPSEKDKLKASENIAKVLGLFEEKASLKVKVENDGFIEAIKAQASEVFKGADIEE